MSLSLKPPLRSALRGSLSYAIRAREQVRAGLTDARVASLRPPEADRPFHRFVYGFSMPLTMMRVGWSNADVRAAMRHRLIPPLLLVALVTVVGVGDIVRSVVAARHDPSALAREIDRDDDGPSVKVTVDKDVVAKAVLAAKAKGGSVDQVVQAAVDAARIDKLAKSARPLRPTGLAAVSRLVSDFLTSKVAALIATLSVLEWVLVWIGREHHDQIAYEMATLTGVPGEALPDYPRLRLDVAWLKMKGWRALRTLLFLGLVAPAAWIVGLVPVVGGYLGVAIEAAWAVYWAGVFAVANTFVVWREPLPAGASPWFMRALDRVGRLPLLGRAARLYARVLRFATKGVWQACMAFEETVWESLGLATARAIASVPVLYITSRPAFTPAATHALLARVAPPEEGVAHGAAALVEPGPPRVEVASVVPPGGREPVSEAAPLPLLDEEPAVPAARDAS